VIVAAFLLCAVNACDRSEEDRLTAVPLFPKDSAPQEVRLLDGTACEEVVRSLQNILPKDMPKEAVNVTTDDLLRELRSLFDVNSVFSVLKNVSMEEGYILDYVYEVTFLGNRPLLYARKAQDPSWYNVVQYKRDQLAQDNKPPTFHTSVPPEAPSLARSFLVEVIQPRYVTLEVYEKEKRARRGASYLRHVRSNGTPEGFFELVLLDIMGSHFYQFSHALYDDDQVICVPSGIPGEKRPEDRSSTFGLPKEVFQQAATLDFQPRVEFAGEHVRVTVVTFGKWRGFARETYTLKRDFPHDIVDIAERILIVYRWGLDY
jgi:hypothetical protein